MTRSHAFSRALRQPHVITSSFDWFNVLSVSYVIGQSNYFGFGFTTLKRKPLYLDVPDPGSKGGTLVKVLAPRQSDRRFVRSDAICGLGLFLVLSLAPRGLFTIQSGLLDENNHSVGALPLNY